MIQRILAIWSLVPLPFLKSSSYIRKFLVHIQLKPSLKDFEYYLSSVWHECNCAVVWAFFGIAFLWYWNENWPFPVLGHCWVFQIYWQIECSTFTVSSFRIWNSSTGIPSPPLALFIILVVAVILISVSVKYSCPFIVYSPRTFKAKSAHFFGQYSLNDWWWASENGEIINPLYFLQRWVLFSSL